MPESNPTNKFILYFLLICKNVMCTYSLIVKILCTFLKDNLKKVTINITKVRKLKGMDACINDEIK